MGLKKRSKVSAEFSMSSLTDIIFLLLIFFMLTSSMIVPNALNLKLPGRSTTKTPPSDVRPSMITIAPGGTYYLNGSKTSKSALDKSIRDIKSKNSKANIVVTPDDNVPNEYVVAVLDMAYRYGVVCSLTDPK